MSEENYKDIISELKLQVEELQKYKKDVQKLLQAYEKEHQKLKADVEMYKRGEEDQFQMGCKNFDRILEQKKALESKVKDLEFKNNVLRNCCNCKKLNECCKYAQDTNTSLDVTDRCEEWVWEND